MFLRQSRIVRNRIATSSTSSRPVPGEFPVEAALSGKLLISSSHTPNFAIERGERNRGTTHHPRGQNVVQYHVKLFPCTQGHFLCSSYHEVLGKTSWQVSRFGQPHHHRFGSDHSRQSRPSEWRMTAAATRRQKRKEKQEKTSPLSLHKAIIFVEF